MKNFILGLLVGLIISILIFLYLQQNKDIQQTTTTLPGGTYGFNYPNDGPVGSLLIYPKSNEEILFSLNVNRGIPSYNNGSLFGRLEKKTIFQYKNGSCEFQITPGANDLEITSSSSDTDCGFGGGVKANGTYQKQSEQIPQYYTNEKGDKIYFQ